MEHKTNLSLSLIALLLCMPAAYGMQKRKVSAASPSTAAPAAAVSPYVQPAHHSNSSSSKTPYCAMTMGACGAISLLPQVACPDVRSECETILGLPQGSIQACSLMTIFCSAAGLVSCKSPEEDLYDALDRIKKIEDQQKHRPLFVDVSL